MIVIDKLIKDTLIPKREVLWPSSLALWSWGRRSGVRIPVGAKILVTKKMSSFHPAVSRYLIQFREGSKAAEGEEWATSFICCALDTVILNKYCISIY